MNYEQGLTRSLQTAQSKRLINLIKRARLEGQTSFGAGNGLIIEDTSVPRAESERRLKLAMTHNTHICPPGFGVPFGINGATHAITAAKEASLIQKKPIFFPVNFFFRFSKSGEPLTFLDVKFVSYRR